jgi:hypothetical protein
VLSAVGTIWSVPDRDARGYPSSTARRSLARLLAEVRVLGWFSPRMRRARARVSSSSQPTACQQAMDKVRYGSCASEKICYAAP